MKIDNAAIEIWKWHFDALDYSSLPPQELAHCIDFLRKQIQYFFPNRSQTNSLSILDGGCGNGLATGNLASALGDYADMYTLDPAVECPFPYRNRELFERAQTLYYECLAGQTDNPKAWHELISKEDVCHHFEPFEKTTFQDQKFDVVCAIFSFDYVDQPTTAREIGRILKPDGRLMLLLHHPRSNIFRNMKMKVAIYSKAIEVLDLLKIGLLENGNTWSISKTLNELKELPALNEYIEPGTLDKFIELAKASGLAAVPWIDKIRKEYSMLRESGVTLVQNPGNIFVDESQVRKFFAQFDFQIEKFAPVGEPHNHFAHGVVIRKCQKLD